MSNRLPHRIVQEHATARDSRVQLGGNVARLSLHPIGVVLPRLEQRMHVDRIDCEHVDKDDGRQVVTELIVDRNLGIEGANCKSGTSLRFDSAGYAESHLSCSTALSLR
jgi:hypothetical protein